MPKTAAELRADKAKHVQQATAISDLAEKEARDLTEAEEAEFADHIARGRDLDAEVRRAERRETLVEVGQELRRSRGRRTAPGGFDGADAGPDHGRGQVLRSWLLAGTPEGHLDSEVIQRGREYGLNVQGQSVVLRALTTAAAPGSNLVAKSFSQQLTEALRASSPLLSLVSLDITSDGQPRLYPAADDTGNEAVIVGEATDLGEGDPALGQAEIATFKYSSRLVKASIEMLQDALVDVEGFIARSIGGRVKQALERHATVGTGVGQPFGLVSSAQTGVGGADKTNPTFDMVIDLEHSVPQQYRDSGVYMLSDDTLKRLKKLKDGQGRPLWQPSNAVGVPSTINGKPYIVSPYLDPWGASKTPMLFGDPRGYTLRQALDVTLTRLDERFAELGLVAWVGLARFGGRYTGVPAAMQKLVTAA